MSRCLRGRVLLLLLLLLHTAAGQAEVADDNQLQNDPRYSIDLELQQHIDNPDDRYNNNNGIQRNHHRSLPESNDVVIVTSSVNNNSNNNNQRANNNKCPAGFFRLRRFCYYLSAGLAQWREAYFQCKARNASLAKLDLRVKDRLLREYLMDERFRKLERWIGGSYNWRKEIWEWGVSGERMSNFTNFVKRSSAESSTTDDQKNYTYSCAVLDPAHEYKWDARRCFEPKYYICEVAAAKTGKKRKSDGEAPQNQRLRTPGKREYDKEEQKDEPAKAVGGKNKSNVKKSKSSVRKKSWLAHSGSSSGIEDNQIWIHGIKLGSRPPRGRDSKKIHSKKSSSKNRHGHHHHHHHRAKATDVQLELTKPAEFEAFTANVDRVGRRRFDENLQRLSGNEANDDANRLFGNDFVREEILLKI
ncbi:hypothetical protein TKK_0007690 [Trichogramma kaykai]